ncbi:MAG: AglZ/HisF2 family acetamidino modification protein [Gammaproteobacteria bacterium]
MMKTRVIPVLLLQGQGLVKTVRFKDPTYIGDPINSIRIFNEKEVDELVFLDISATAEGREPNYQIIEDIAGEAFMPLAYGGGVGNLEQAQRIFALGFEKIVLSAATYDNERLITELVGRYGSSSVVACVDCKRNLFGRHELFTHNGKVRRKRKLVEHVKRLAELGVGEIIVNSIDRDGTQRGYDIELIASVAGAVAVPVVACGGASGVEDFEHAVSQGGASAVAAGSLFVFKGPHRAVLINYPDRGELTRVLP